MKKILPAIVAGVVIGIVEVIPFIKSLSCCILVPAAVYYAMVLEIKGNKKILPFTLGEALRLGVLTGIFGAIFSVFFDSFLTFVLRTNDFVTVFPQMQQFIQEMGLPEESKKEILSLLQGMAENIRTTGISVLYSLSMFISNLFFDILLGLIGGALVRKLINKKYFAEA